MITRDVPIQSDGLMSPPLTDQLTAVDKAPGQVDPSHYEKRLPVSQPFGYREDRTPLWCDAGEPAIGKLSKIREAYKAVAVHILCEQGRIS